MVQLLHRAGALVKEGICSLKDYPITLPNHRTNPLSPSPPIQQQPNQTPPPLINFFLIPKTLSSPSPKTSCPLSPPQIPFPPKLTQIPQITPIPQNNAFPPKTKTKKSHAHLFGEEADGDLCEDVVLAEEV